MKAIKTRSPINLFYEDVNLDRLFLSIWVSDDIAIDTSTDADYILSTSAINGFASFEVSELIRSKNNYIFNADFYDTRDTAKYVLIRGRFLNTDDEIFEIKHDLLRIRDGYVQRTEDPQIYQNLISTDPNGYDVINNTTITDSTDSPFGTSESYLLEDINNASNILLEKTLALEGLYTFSVFVKQNNSSNLYSLGDSSDNRVVFDLTNENVDEVLGDVVSYDLRVVDSWVLISVCIDLDTSSRFRFQSDDNVDVQSVFFFNPTIVKGNQLNNEARELILQDNIAMFSDGVIDVKIGFDSKKSNLTYSYDGFSISGFLNSNPLRQSVFTNATTGVLTYDQLDRSITARATLLNTLDECKYTPVKVSFVNRFGVIQDLVFFKKREDSIKTEKEGYRANVLQGANFYQHIGESQNISKTSKREVSLNTGFYSEGFNTVFEQLQNSLYYWLDDEPVSLEDSDFSIKTSVNDKLINYTFRFSYSNNEINTIR